MIGGVGLIMLLGRRRTQRRKVVVDPVPQRTVVVDPVPQGVRNGPRSSGGRLQRIAELLARFSSTTPQVFKLVRIRSGQSIESVVREAFDLICQTTVEQRRHYIHCVSSSSYNAAVYGTPSTTKRFGAELLTPGTGLGLRVAFLPRNEDAYHAMLVGNMPSMTVDSRTGEPRTTDTSLGMVWLPPVYEEGLRRGDLPTCAPYSYEDGSSTIDPPPSLLVLLKGGQ